MSFIAVFISFFLESLFTNFIPTTFTNFSPFLPFFTIISIILIYPYTKNNKSYFITAGFTGLIYDIAITNTLFLNTLVFLTIAILVAVLNKHFNQTGIFNFLLSLGILIYYQLITLALLSITGSKSFQIITIFMIFISSIIINLVYLVILYLILKKVSINLKLKPRH